MKTKKTIMMIAGAAVLAAALPAMPVSAEEGINVCVAVSNGGVVELANRNVTVTDLDGDGKYTIDETLYAAHEQCYGGGAAAGYSSSQSDWGLSLTKLWGVANGGSYGYYHNDQMAMGLSDEVKDGDYLSAFIYGDTTGFSDKYSYFDVKDAEIGEQGNITLTLTAVLFDENWAPYTEPVKNAKITIDTVDSTFVTDENGKVTLTLDVPGNHIISAHSDSMTLAAPVLTVFVKPEETEAIDVTTTAPAVTTTLINTTGTGSTTAAGTYTSVPVTTSTTATAAATTAKPAGNTNSSSSEAAKTGETAAIPALALAAAIGCGIAYAARRRHD